MASLNLTGFETVFENEVYSRDKTGTTDKGVSVSLKAILIPKKYSEPSEDGVVGYLQRKAREVKGAASLVLPGPVKFEGKSLLESALINISEELRKHLIIGNEEFTRIVRGVSPARAISKDEPRNQYLYLRYGLIPNSIIERNTSEGDLQEAEWYEAALSHDRLRESGLGERWNLELLLQDGKLPDKRDIDILLKHRTHGSRTLEISRINYPLDEVQEVMDSIYASFSRPEEIALLKDITEQKLDKISLATLIRLMEFFKQRSLEAKAMEAFRRSLGDSGNGKE